MMPSVRHKVTSGMSSMEMVRVTLKNNSWQRLITIESPVSLCCKFSHSLSLTVF